MRREVQSYLVLVGMLFITFDKSGGVVEKMTWISTIGIGCCIVGLIGEPIWFVIGIVIKKIKN